MDNFSDIKSIWLSAKTDAPDNKEMLRIIKQHAKKQVLKKVWMIFLLLLLGAAMTQVVISYHSVLITTRLGEAGMLIAIISLLVIKARSLGRDYKQTNSSNNEYLEFLLQRREKQFSFYRRAYGVIYLFSSLGLLLYVYEGVQGQYLIMAIAYLLLLAWIIVCWFVIRPRNLKKEEKKRDDMIEQLKKFSQQLSNN